MPPHRTRSRSPIGLLQDMSSPNVAVGYLVPEFDVWNLQYATLTDKSADDFSTIPGLAESWEGSADGLTYTYHLRDGLQWSDGEPLTADDVAYTINRSRDEEWANHSSTTANLDATVDRRPDGPDHELGARPEAADDGRLHRSQAHLRAARRRRHARVRRHGRRRLRPVHADRVAVRAGLDDGRRTRTGGAATTASTGSCSASSPTPTRWWPRCNRARSTSPTTSRPSRSSSCKAEDDIETVAGQQGGFTELALNGGAGGIGDGHPALQDINVRHAIYYAIDRDVLFDRVALGLGAKGHDDLAVRRSELDARISATRCYTYDPDRANQILDDAGYLDTDGDGDPRDARRQPAARVPLRRAVGVVDRSADP